MSELIDKWLARAKELADNAREYPALHKDDLAEAHALVMCASELLLKMRAMVPK